MMPPNTNFRCTLPIFARAFSAAPVNSTFRFTYAKCSTIELRLRRLPVACVTGLSTPVDDCHTQVRLPSRHNEGDVAMGSQKNVHIPDKLLPDERGRTGRGKDGG
ncbi:hypothetical protein SBA4_2530006 [Candidatus Sulfopaludibacter sp. SbA4]|nr:hypothetical protein SBA4_2530006 [Candidatus Sulfopaludibacter sp. SbA4]